MLRVEVQHITQRRLNKRDSGCSSIEKLRESSYFALRAHHPRPLEDKICSGNRLPHSGRSLQEE